MEMDHELATIITASLESAREDEQRRIELDQAVAASLATHDIEEEKRANASIREYLATTPNMMHACPHCGRLNEIAAVYCGVFRCGWTQHGAQLYQIDQHASNAAVKKMNVIRGCGREWRIA